MKGRNESSIPGSPATTVSHLHFHSYRDEGVTPTILSFFVLAHRLTVKEEINLWNHERARDSYQPTDSLSSLSFLS